MASLRSQRLVVDVDHLVDSLPAIVPWLDRLVPGVWLSPSPPRTPGGMNDFAAEVEARRGYRPRRAFVPWHSAALVKGWGIDCGSLPAGLGWRPLDQYSVAELHEEALSILAHGQFSTWLRFPPGERRLPYQLAAIGYAAKGVQSMALHWTTGAGKTRAAIETALYHSTPGEDPRAWGGDRRIPKPIVVLSPSNVVRHWARQVRKWTTIAPIEWVAPSRRTKRDLASMEALRAPLDENSDPLVVIVSHDNIGDAWACDLQSLSPGVVCFDEAHRFKGTKRNAAIPTEDGGVEFVERKTAGGARTEANVLVDVAEWATARIELTATPVANRFAQLWVQLNLLDPSAFGSYYTWSARYAAGRPGEYGGWEARGAVNIEEHRAHIRYFFFEVPASESNALLPKKRRETVYLPVSEQVQELGGWVKILAKSKAEGRGRELEARLMLAASRKRRYVLSRALEAMRAGQKVVILTGRRLDVTKLFEGLGDAAKWWASGELSQDERVEACDQYMSWRPEEHGGFGCCLVGTLDCLGIGIDLQDTDLALMAMLPWEWATLWQSEGRFQRQGMTRPVLIEFVIAEGTYDEHVCQSFLAKLPAIGSATPDEEVAKVGESLRGLSDVPALLASIFSKLTGGTDDDNAVGED